MIKPDYKIIAVDNDQSELDLLLSTLHEVRIPCIPIKYDVGKDYDYKFSGVRIAFFDINLVEGNNTGSQLYSIISHALSQIIDENNGPYALIFWTKHQVDIKDIIKYIQDPRRGLSIPTPLIIDSIDKTKISSLEELLPEINRVLSNSILETLLDFEEKAQKSASQAINSVFSIIPKGNDKWGENRQFNENFNKVFSKIAVNSLGYDHAKDNPDKAVYEAFIPIISHNLLNSIDSKWQTVLTNLVESQNKNGIEYPESFNVSKLNSIFHIDKVTDGKNNRRGTVSEYKPTPIEANNRFDYIKNMYDECKSLFSKFITFEDGNITPNLNEFIRSSSKFIVIEISSACDYSQEKPRNNKFVLGVLTPSNFYKHINMKNISDAVFYKEMPLINFEDVDYNIWLQLNYTLSDFEINQNIGSPLFILKKEIMDMIGNRYANHISRIGITTF